MKCPRCGHKSFYPGFRLGECANAKCDLFSEKQYQIWLDEEFEKYDGTSDSNWIPADLWDTVEPDGDTPTPVGAWGAPGKKV